MIKLLDIIALLLEWGYSFVFFWMLHTFIPLRKSWLLRIPALLCCGLLACDIVYSGDLPALLGELLGFFAYTAVFHRGKWTEKITAVLVFYPAVIAVNYLMQDMGSRLFFSITNAPSEPLMWTQKDFIISTAIHTFSLFLRLIFWVGTWLVLRRYLKRITSVLTTKMWLMIDALMLAPLIAIFTIIYFVSDKTVIAYPVCGASIFSSFGCMYFTSYICSAAQTAYHAQELEMRRAYLSDRISEEERVRSIYHDMKNHLLVLEAQSVGSQEVSRSIKTLQEQIADYENYHHTGNDFLDIIIRDKSRAAREKHIDFNAVISFEEGSFISPLDISTIFGNAIDNAIEASERLPEDQRLITVKASRVRDMLVIAVENNRAPGGEHGEKTTKQDAFLHGFGIPNIKKAAEKYSGQCTIESLSDTYRIKILLPIPD